MTTYRCPHCDQPTEDYEAHLEPDTELPVSWITRWSKDPTCSHSHAKRFEREVEGKGRFGGHTEYRFGIVADRVCWPCNSVMPYSVCEVRP